MCMDYLKKLHREGFKPHKTFHKEPDAWDVTQELRTKGYDAVYVRCGTPIEGCDHWTVMRRVKTEMENADEKEVAKTTQEETIEDGLDSIQEEMAEAVD